MLSSSWEEQNTDKSVKTIAKPTKLHKIKPKHTKWTSKLIFKKDGTDLELRINPCISMITF